MTTTASVAAIVTRTADTLTVPLPSGFVGAVEAAENLITCAEAVGAGPSALHTAALDCLERGADPGLDKNTVAAVVRHHLSVSGIGGAARAKAEADIGSALLEYADDILTGWSLMLAPHLDALTAAATELPEDIGDYEAIVGRGSSALSAWQNATTAIRMLGAATSAVSALAGLAHIGLVRDKIPLIYTQPDPQACDQIRSTGAQVTAWLAVRAGIQLGLVASLPELVARLEDDDEQRRQAAADYESARRPKRPSYLPTP